LEYLSAHNIEDKLTPIGHTLTGLAIGYLAIPRETPIKQKTSLLAAFAVLASVPDLPFPYWGHSDYEVSHGLFMTTIGTGIMAAFLWFRFRGRPPITLGVMLAMALAWYSHLLLDSLYNHAIGLQIYWPFSKGRIAFPVPWLTPGNKYDIFSMHNVKVALYEIATFAPLLLLAVVVKDYLLPLWRTDATEAVS
jgi:membrane-bound metal-dependent hydrolase YbcI (DUF457 family)